MSVYPGNGGILVPQPYNIRTIRVSGVPRLGPPTGDVVLSGTHSLDFSPLWYLHTAIYPGNGGIQVPQPLNIRTLGLLQGSATTVNKDT